MKKSPFELQEDIYKVLDGTAGEFTREISEWVGSVVAESVHRQLTQDNRCPGTLRLSSLGTQCERKLWYSVNMPDQAEPIPPYARNKFIYGDIIEAYVLGLCKAAGHHVSGLQDTVDVCGIRGSRDCIISGMLFDVKSASTNSMGKFKSNGLRTDDPFGYLSQLSSYLYGSQSDPLLEYKDKAGFIAVDKQFGHVLVDIYDLSEEVAFKEGEVKHKKKVTKNKNPPERPFEPVPDGKSGNMKLPTVCSYCDYRKTCWPEARVFLYSSGPRFLTHVEKTPEVTEVTE